MNSDMSVMAKPCLFLHGPSSIIRHSRPLSAAWQNGGMLDLDLIRERIASRYRELGLSQTGVWHKDHGIGQTTVRNFLDGSTSSLTLDTVTKLEKPLKTTAEWMIFGDQPARAVSEAELRAMVDDALSEMQPGMSIAEIRPAVASSLRGQLERVLSGQAALNRPESESVPDTTAQSRAATKRSAPAARRTT